VLILCFPNPRQRYAVFRLGALDAMFEWRQESHEPPLLPFQGEHEMQALGVTGSVPVCLSSLCLIHLDLLNILHIRTKNCLLRDSHTIEDDSVLRTRVV
jgi:hypothetical protein